MRKQFIIFVGCIISSVASAQEWRPSVDKWRSCADAAAARYSKTAESAPVAARLAGLSCANEKKQIWQAVSQHDGARFADDYVDTVERSYGDSLEVRGLDVGFAVGAPPPAKIVYHQAGILIVATGYDRRCPIRATHYNTPTKPQANSSAPLGVNFT
jgi:hypothetical protein